MVKLCLPAALLFVVATLHANVFTFHASSPDACAGSPCAASATFSIQDANDFTVTLYNTYTPINDGSQVLSDLEFTLTASNVTMASSFATYINLPGNGIPNSPGSGSTGWGFGAIPPSDTWLLCVACFDGVTATASIYQGILPDQPLYTQIPPIALPYLNNSTSQPYMASGASFVFHTDATLDPNGTDDPFGGVMFSFASCGNYVVPASPNTPETPVPEPAGFILVGGASAVLALVRRLRLS